MTVVKFERPEAIPAAAPVPEKPKVKRKKVVRNMSRAKMLREMKLGKRTMWRIKGTSLDSAAEMDELIVLNRGAPEGKITPLVRKLVREAAAGKDVSAIAEATKMGGRPTRAVSLVAAWRKRMVSTWDMADEEERIKFLAYLSMKFDAGRRAVLLDHLIENVTTLKPTEP